MIETKGWNGPNDEGGIETFPPNVPSHLCYPVGKDLMKEVGLKLT